MMIGSNASGFCTEEAEIAPAVDEGVDAIPGVLFVDHVAIAVRQGELDGQVRAYELLGFREIHREEVRGSDQVREALLQVGDGPNLIQLLEPLSADSPVQTLYDRHVNVLRSTTEAISAVLGGADSISIAPFDECCRTTAESSRRLARNAQIILKREALLDQVSDPLGGSYLIEILTNSIATRAWKLFQELESAGGYPKAKEAGIIAAVLARRTKAREDAVAARRLVLTGTNRFADVAERVADFADAPLPDVEGRAASQFEDLRLRAEHYTSVHGSLPSIVLAEIGDQKMRSARSQFAADFLSCGGLRAEVRLRQAPRRTCGQYCYRGPVPSGSNPRSGCVPAKRATSDSLGQSSARSSPRERAPREAWQSP